MREFSEASIDVEKSYEYILSIQVSLDGFSFSILRPSDKVLLYFKNTPLKISSNTLLVRRFKEWIETEELLQKPFQRVRVIVFSEKFALVPTHFQQKDLNKDLLHLLFKDYDSLQFAENLVEKLNAKLLFAIPDGINPIINNSIGECEINHPLKLIISSLLRINEKQSLMLLFGQHNIQLIIIKSGIVLMANSFKINHVYDVVYFILTALKQFAISSRETKLFYAGKSNYSANSISSLKKHFTTIESLRANKLKNPNEISEQVLSENISLFL